MRRISIPAVALVALLLVAPAEAATESGAGGDSALPPTGAERAGGISAIPSGERGEADDALVVVNGDVTVGRGQFVEGVYIVHGDARIAGRVDNDVIVVSGDVLLSGRVGGDLMTIAGRARLLPSARVGGDVNYSDERPVVASAARVGGSVEKQTWPDSLGVASFFVGFAFWLAGVVSTLLLGALLLLIAPRAAVAIAAESRKRIGVTIAIGIAIAIALPVTGLIAAITVLGLPLAIGIFLAMAPIAVVAYVASALALGRAIVKEPRSPYLAFLAGLAILSASGLIPVIGWLVGLAAVIFGLGLIGGAIGAARSTQEAAPASSHSA